MQRTALKILKKVSKEGEISLAAAIRMAKPRHKNHIDQYPLALLLEEGYLGMTLTHTSPSGLADKRELSLATTFHTFTLPRGPDGRIHYRGIISSGGVDMEVLEKDWVFLKAKGSLYLEERSQRFWDRLWTFVLGFVGGLSVALGAAWVKAILKLS